MNFDNSDSRRAVEHCFRTTSTMINPILHWTEDDVWEFLHHYGCQGNPLYQCGKKRIGCIGCPLGSSASMKRELKEYPKYKENYIRAFDRMLEERKKKKAPAKKPWLNGEDVLNWWVGNDTGQLYLDGFDILDL